MPDLIVIAGPTASGKTSLAVALAEKLKCPVFSADSRQFYKEMSIGTAKPYPEEQKGVPHYFIDSHSIEKPLSSGKFEKEALSVLENIYDEHDTAILVGGSGMYIDALVYGTDQLPHDPVVREKFNQIYEEKGIQYLQQLLKDRDPAYYEKIDLNNPVRLIRALELIEITGKKNDALRKEKSPDRPFNTYYFVIEHDREKLYDRINKRVDIMVENGLIEEVKSLLPYRELQPLNTVGYKEVIDYFDNKHDLDRAIELIKRNTRRYAKRQLTWFRRNKNCVWIEYTDISRMCEQILSFIRHDD